MVLTENKLPGSLHCDQTGFHIHIFFKYICFRPITQNLLKHLVTPYIEFLEEYCLSIFTALNEKHIENHTIERYQMVTCLNVLKKKTVICLSIENYMIKVGDLIIIKTAEIGNEHFYKKDVWGLV